MNNRFTAIVGPMKSGKSMRLIEQIEYILNYSKDIDESNILIFKPEIDTRTKDVIESRNGKFKFAYLVNNFNDINIFINNSRNIKYIFIDELQFLIPVGMRDFFILCNKKNISVVASGLELTSELVPFNTTALFLCYASNIIKASGYCEICESNPSLITDFDGKGKVGEIKVGDSEYKATCYNCHNLLKK